jgi:hypothetical protein
VSGTSLAVVVALGIAIPCATAGCGDDGSPAAPATTQGTLSEASVGDATDDYAVCPPGLDASFSDLLTRVFATSSCGTDNPHSCHSATGSGPMGAGDLLDFTREAGAVYTELLGGNGKGQPAANISGDTAILRVAPGDAGASMLYVKLTLRTLNDPHYGAGMPLTAPASICPEALDAVKTWIDQGAHP